VLIGEATSPSSRPRRLVGELGDELHGLRTVPADRQRVTRVDRTVGLDLEVELVRSWSLLPRVGSIENDTRRTGRRSVDRNQTPIVTVRLFALGRR